VAGTTVTLQVEARRFYCDQRDCARHTFSEAFPGWLAPYQRRTRRLEHTVRALGLALGGEAGARLARQLAIRLSPDTVLRVLHRQEFRPALPPRRIGVDDWAFRRGHRYGTLLVDLERHRPIDLLPDRKAQTLAAWLKQHPGIELISRDRAGAYAEGARQGAPDALQVADRWHLLKNLRETMERVLNRHHRALQRTAEAVATVPPTVATTAVSATPDPDSGPGPRRLTRAERDRSERRERRLARYQAVLELDRQGGSIRAIARQLGLQRVTVRRYLQAEGFAERAARAAGPSLLDPFRPYLQQRWDAGCHNARHLFRELLEQGFQGSESIVQRALRAWRPVGSSEQSSPPGADRLTATPAGPIVRCVSPRQASFWLLELAKPCDPEERQRQQAFVAQLCERVPAIGAAHTLGVNFIRLLRQRRGQELPSWLDRAEHADRPEFGHFARSLRQDYEAVRAAFRLPWSQGQVEGQVNRLKSIKRSMYGRAGFDLLRIRVLAAA
jgi:transposase